MKEQEGAKSKPSHHNPPSTKFYTCYNVVSSILLATAKLRLIHRIAKWRSMIYHSREHISTAIESSCSVFYTTSAKALALGDVRLGYSCSAMETHPIRLSMQCS